MASSVSLLVYIWFNGELLYILFSPEMLYLSASSCKAKNRSLFTILTALARLQLGLVTWLLTYLKANQATSPDKPNDLWENNPRGLQIFLRDIKTISVPLDWWQAWITNKRIDSSDPRRIKILKANYLSENVHWADLCFTHIDACAYKRRYLIVVGFGLIRSLIMSVSMYYDKLYGLSNIENMSVAYLVHPR